MLKLRRALLVAGLFAINGILAKDLVGQAPADGTWVAIGQKCAWECTALGCGAQVCVWTVGGMGCGGGCSPRPGEVCAGE
jgi:hypothetical protein